MHITKHTHHRILILKIPILVKMLTTFILQFKYFYQLSTYIIDMEYVLPFLYLVRFMQRSTGFHVSNSENNCKIHE